jgi:hypothetical protein
LYSPTCFVTLSPWREAEGREARESYVNKEEKKAERTCCVEIKHKMSNYTRNIPKNARYTGVKDFE